MFTNVLSIVYVNLDLQSADMGERRCGLQASLGRPLEGV